MNEHPGDMVNREEMLSSLKELLRWCGTLEAQLHQTRTRHPFNGES